jgi:hypothetical protein
MTRNRKFHPSAGIAIGPILFMIAMLAVLAMVMSSGGGGFQTVGITDRIANDIAAQSNLIRSTINSCNMEYILAASTRSVATAADPYPDSIAAGTNVSALVCDPMGGAPLWGAALMLPPPTRDFSVWKYVNAGDSGGRCFWTTPTVANPKTNQAVKQGLIRAASKFNSAAANDGDHEVVYNPASDSQKFIVFITMPTGAIDSNCAP